jgi:hypothetical protein
VSCWVRLNEPQGLCRPVMSSAVRAAGYKHLSVIQTVKRVKRLSQRTLKYENHPTCCYLTCTQAWSWSNCLPHEAVSECDIVLATQQNTSELDLLWDCEPSAQEKQWGLRGTNMTASLALRDWSCQWSWQWMQCRPSHVGDASWLVRDNQTTLSDQGRSRWNLLQNTVSLSEKDLYR